MAVREGILSLLSEEPTHGYQLKTSFESHTGGAWMINVGQVYTTLQRLERDGLVVAAGTDGDRQMYRITTIGRRALEQWFAEPVIADPPPRDELTIKVLLAIASEDVDVAGLLQRQRTAAVEHLQQLTRQKATADVDDDLPWVLLLDALILKTQAEVQWLDMCEARIRQRRTKPTGPTEQATRPRGGRS